MARIVRPSKGVRRGVVEKARPTESHVAVGATADAAGVNGLLRGSNRKQGTGWPANYNAHPCVFDPPRVDIKITET
jgi:hypothetical protein